ncbi:MAG: pitrilysin family protein [bacterium]
MANDNVYKEVLSNGITVLINESHEAPVVGCNFWVKTGSVYEKENEKGLTHFIEHLLFKGTKKRAVGQLDKEVKALGGYNNAFTTYDATNFVIVLPSEYVKKALEIEYDALTASVFDEVELNKERQVVLEELKRGLDNPDNFLWQKLMELSFESHYKTPIIGYEENLKKFTRSDIVGYWKKHYSPDNLIVVVSGDVKKDEVMGYVKEIFGRMERPKNVAKEVLPLLALKQNTRFKKYTGEIDGRYLAVAFRIADASNPDTAKMEILSRILGGSESSVFYQSIKEEKQLVDSIDCGIYSGKFGGLFVVVAEPRQGKFSETLKEIFARINELKKTGVKNSDIDKVKSDLIREQSKENMKVENMAINLGDFEMLGDYKKYFEYFSNMKKVTDDDIAEVLRKYISPENANVVVYYPATAKKELEKYNKIKDIKPLLAATPEKKGAQVGKVVKKTLVSGALLLSKKRTSTPVVAIKFIFKGGAIAETDANNGITNLMLDTMFKGTQKMTAKEFAAKIDSLGIVLSKDINKDSFGFSAELTKDNLEDFFEVFSDMVLNPKFDAGEMDKERQDILNRIGKIKDEPAAYADKLFNKELFGQHPYKKSLIGETDSVKNLTVKELKAWHTKFVTPTELIISTVGNADAGEIATMINKCFIGWKGGKKNEIKIPENKMTKGKKYNRQIINKNQVHIILGFLGPKVSSKDVLPFRVLDSIMSGGMNSRLFTEIREKRNLCYTVYSMFDRTLERGAFRVYTATSPENETLAITELMKVLGELYKNGVTEQEVTSAKTYMIGMYKIGMQDYMAQAASYGLYEFWGLGYDMVDRMPEEIAKVTKADVNNVIKKYFELENYSEVVVGPKKSATTKGEKK